MKRVSFLVTLLLVLGAWVFAEAANPPKDVTIYDIQTLNGVVLGDSVRVRDVIITGIDTSPSTYGFWAEQPGGGIYSGILCYTGNAFPTGLAVGDSMKVTGVYAEYGGADTSSALSEINSYYSWYWEKLGSNATVPPPTLLSCRDLGIISTDAPRCERWEGTLVKLDTVVCVRLDPTYPTSSYFLVEAHAHPPSTNADTVYVRNDRLISPGPAVPAVGDTLISITGLHHYESGMYQICPRDGDDLVYKGAPPAPNLALAYSTSNTSIEVVFDAKLDETTAENTNNYSLGSETGITLATLDPVGEQIVTLTTDTQVPGTYETLTACCIKGASGTLMPAPQDYSFRSSLCPISLVQTPKAVDNDSSQYSGDEVTIAGIVTADKNTYVTHFYIEQSHAGPWSGIQIFGGIPTTVAEGDSVIVAGLVSEHYGMTQLTDVDYVRVVSSGNPVPGPDLVVVGQINKQPGAEQYEGVFVRCDTVSVVDTTGYALYGECKVADLTPDSITIGHSANYTYVPRLGQWLDIRGPLEDVYPGYYESSRYRLCPRDSQDIVELTKGVQVTKKPPPDRDGPNPPGDNESCPPGPDKHTKGIPDRNLGDKDVNNDDVDDFFMGESKFVLGDKDLIVRTWAINKDPLPSGAFGDYFSFEILTSEKGNETTAIPAGTPT
jgi:hypothetical protein